MKTVEEVLQKYTLGEAGKDETNDGLKELGSPLRLDLPQQFGDSDIFQMDRHGRVSGGNAPDGHKQKNE